MKKIYFSTNRFTNDKYFIVSDESYELVNNFKWRVHKNQVKKTHSKYYRICRYGSVEEQKQGWSKVIMLHRFIFNLKGKQNEKIIIDHKNGWLDNTLESLRKTTSKNNKRYRKLNCNRKYDLPKGVHAEKVKKNPYSAKITVNNKPIHLGMFKTIELAQEAYWEAAIKYFGEFAKKE